MDALTRIRQLNDDFRRTGKGGRIQFTPEVAELDPHVRGRALSYLIHFSSFSDMLEDEHDSGVFRFAGYSWVWAIGYRKKDGTGVSEDPSDPDKTLRVLTLHINADILNEAIVHEVRHNVEMPEV